MTSDYLSPSAALSTFIYLFTNLLTYIFTYFCIISLVKWTPQGSRDIWRFVTESLSILLLKRCKHGPGKSAPREAVYLLSACDSHCVLNWQEGSLLNELFPATLLFRSHLLNKTALSLQIEEEKIEINSFLYAIAIKGGNTSTCFLIEPLIKIIPKWHKC